MIEHRPLAELSGGDLGWLKARHHFYVGRGNPAHQALGDLVVWNDDHFVSDEGGFGPHPHKDIEIITYVRSGFVLHKDNFGNTGRTDAGDVQVMSAGTGIVHDEITSTEGDGTRILQIWIKPRRPGGEPRWGTKPFPKGDRAGRFVPLASGFPEDEDAVPMRADARLLGATLLAGQSIDYPLGGRRRAYLVPTVGSLNVNGTILAPGDGAAARQEEVLRIEALSDTEIVLVDVA